MQKKLNRRERKRLFRQDNDINWRKEAREAYANHIR
jgi:hypothetical protein